MTVRGAAFATVLGGLLALALTASPPSFGTGAPTETEPNDDRDQAQLVQVTPPGEALRGSVGGPDEDWYAVDAPAGSAVLADLGTTASPLRAALFAPDGTLLDARDTNGRRLAGYARGGGRYLLRVRPASSSAPATAYDLTLAAQEYPPPGADDPPTVLQPAQRYGLAQLEAPSWQRRGGSVEVADVTGDGRPDVILSAWHHAAGDLPSVHVFRTLPSGMLARSQDLVLTDGSWYGADLGLASGDLTSSPGREVVLAHARGVRVMPRATGGLARGSVLRTPVPVEWATVTNLDGDSRREVLTGGEQGVVVLDQRDGAWRSRTVIGVHAYPVRVANVSGDRTPELVGAVVGGRDVRVWRRTATGGYQQLRTLDLRSGELGVDMVDSLVVTDVDGDGRRDDVVARDDRAVNVFRRTDTHWTAARVSSPPRSNFTTADDVDGDGLVELVAPDRLTELGRDGTVTGTSTWYADLMASTSDPVAVGDLTGDGLADVVAAGWTGPEVHRNGFVP